MNVSIRSNKGFSLVELMVVVAIIGILAAIAVPNFQRFAAKSKQTEAKANLSALYSAERAFQSEWQFFKADFGLTGYSPTGNLRYHHGFTAENATTVPNLPTPAKAEIETTGYCGTTTVSTANYCVEITAPVAVVALSAAAATDTTFVAQATGNLTGTAGVTDTWHIDQSKNIKNDTIGY